MKSMKSLWWLALAGLLALGSAAASTSTSTTAPTAESALAELKAGNTRLSCADSRVPPEIVFDRGLGARSIR